MENSVSPTNHSVQFSSLYTVHCTLCTVLYTVWPKNCICHYFHSCDGGGVGVMVVVVMVVVVVVVVGVVVVVVVLA